MTAPQRTPGPNFLVRVAVTIILLWGMAGLYYYYFYMVPNETGVPQFYKAWKEDDSSALSATDIEATLKGHYKSRFKALAVRSAFMRYQLDNAPGGTFDKYMASYQQGRWTIPPTDVWREQFKKFTAAWEASRIEILKAKPELPAPRIAKTEQGLPQITYAALPTAQLGKRLIIEAQVPSAEVLTQLIEVQLYFEGIPEPVVFYTAWGTSLKEGKATARLDMLAEPEWMRPRMQLNRIVLSGSRAPEWQLDKVQFVN